MFVNLKIHSFDEMPRIFIFSFCSRVTASHNQNKYITDEYFDYVALTAVFIRRYRHGRTANYYIISMSFLTYAQASYLVHSV